MAKVRVEKMAYAQDISETEFGVGGKIDSFYQDFQTQKIKYFHLDIQFVQHFYVCV